MRHQLQKLFRNKFSGRAVVAEKSRIREEIKRMKFQMSPNQKEAEASAVFRKIEAMPVFQRAQTILMYWSMSDELPTHDFIKKWSESKTILLPVVKGEQMIVRKFTGENDLKSGTFGFDGANGKAGFTTEEKNDRRKDKRDDRSAENLF